MYLIFSLGYGGLSKNLASPTRQRPVGGCERYGGLERCCASLGNPPDHRSDPTLSTRPDRSVATQSKLRWSHRYRPESTYYDYIFTKIIFINIIKIATLTSVIRSYSFVITDTERVQYGRYVDIAQIATPR